MKVVVAHARTQLGSTKPSVGERSIAARMAPCVHPRRSAFFAAGQAMIEFALVGGLLVLVLLMGIQLAVIGESQLSVNQLAYSAARYASVYYFSDSALQSTGSISGDSKVAALVPPSLTTSSSGSTTILQVNLVQSCEPTSGGTGFGQVAQVQVQYDLVASNRIFLPNPFFGISLPTSVSATQKAFCE